jgi:hypothetical protein
MSESECVLGGFCGYVRDSAGMAGARCVSLQADMKRLLSIISLSTFNFSLLYKLLRLTYLLRRNSKGTTQREGERGDCIPPLPLPLGFPSGLSFLNPPTPRFGERALRGSNLGFGMNSQWCGILVKRQKSAFFV